MLGEISLWWFINGGVLGLWELFYYYCLFYFIEMNHLDSRFETSTFPMLYHGEIEVRILF
jgi:hypothetical protein